MKHFASLPRILILAAFFAWALTSCTPSVKVSTTGADKPRSSQKKSELTEEQIINVRYLYVNALKEKMKGNNEAALEMFSQCIRIDGSNHAAMYEIAMIYMDMKKLSEALFFANSAVSADPANKWYKLFLGEVYMAAGEYDKAEKLYNGLYREHPGKMSMAFKYVAVLLFNGKIQDAIDVYDEMESTMGINPDIIREKERLYLRLGKTEKAAAELEKLISEYPGNMEYYSLLVELYQVNEMPEKAFEVIQRMQEVKPESPFVYLALAEYYRSNNQKQKSFEQLRLAFGSLELDSDVKLKIITSYIPLAEQSEEMMDQALTLSRIMAETHPGESLAQAIYGDFLYISSEYDQAIVQFKKSLGIDESNFVVWQQLLNCYIQKSDFDGLLENSQKAIELFPDQVVIYWFHGTALSQKKMYNEAIKYLISGSKMVVEDDQLLADFYSNIGNNYHEIKNYHESDKYFEKALKLDPENPFVLNNYSYFLSLRGENLDKAEEMSKLSNELQPNQASFQDTYGWILYRQGKYHEAKKWLDKAIENGGSSSGAVLEHYGDVLYQLGDKAKAHEYWLRAKETGDEDVSEFINQKIRDKRLYE